MISKGCIFAFLFAVLALWGFTTGDGEVTCYTGEQCSDWGDDPDARVMNRNGVTYCCPPDPNQGFILNYVQSPFCKCRVGITEQTTGTTQQTTGTTQQNTGTTDQNAGTTEQNAGTTEQNAGTTEQNTGTTEQNAGTTEQNTGTTEQKAGTTEQNAGTTEQNAGTTEQNAGTTEQNPGTTEQNAGTTQNPTNGSLGFSCMVFGPWYLILLMTVSVGMLCLLTNVLI